MISTAHVVNIFFLVNWETHSAADVLRNLCSLNIKDTLFRGRGARSMEKSISYDERGENGN